MSLELQATRQAAAAAALRTLQGDVEKQRAAITADGRAGDARRGQLDVLAAELSKEREYLTSLAAQLQVRAKGGGAGR